MYVIYFAHFLFLEAFIYSSMLAVFLLFFTLIPERVFSSGPFLHLELVSGIKMLQHLKLVLSAGLNILWNAIKKKGCQKDALSPWF